MKKRLVKQLVRVLVFLSLMVLVSSRFEIYEKLMKTEPIPYILGHFAFAAKVFFFSYLGLIGLSIFLYNDNPSSTIAWILVFFASPFWGFVAYLIFGRSFNINMGKRRKIRKALREVDWIKDELVLPRYFEHEKLAKMIYRSSGATLSVYNNTKLYLDGENQFQDVMEDIKRAKKSIDVEYYIIKNDATGREFTDCLCERAREGIEVNLIYDDVGSYNMDDEILDEFKEAGVNVESFLPLRLPRLTESLNYRNHRKIIIIDGELAYIGGMNIGDEYRSLNSHFNFWRDSHLRIQGDAVSAIQRCFVQDWLFATSNSSKSDKEYIRKKLSQPMPKSESLTFQPMQIVSSGPDTRWQSIRQAYFQMICSAKKSITITTPYLVPDETILSALNTAALSGIEVNIVVPKMADHFFVYWSTRSNFGSLLDAGVNIYEYEKGFMHSKGIVVDGSLSSIGTANFDIRSLKINFEINAFIYDEGLSREIQDSFDEDIRNSTKVERKTYQKRPIWIKFLEAVGRMVSPLQ